METNSSWHVAHVHVLSDIALAGLCVAGCPVGVGISPDISTSGPSPTSLGSSGGSSAFRFVPRRGSVTVSVSAPSPTSLGSSGGASAVRFAPLVGAAPPANLALCSRISRSRLAAAPAGVGDGTAGTVAPGSMGGGNVPRDEAPGGVTSSPPCRGGTCGSAVFPPTARSQALSIRVLPSSVCMRSFSMRTRHSRLCAACLASPLTMALQPKHPSVGPCSWMSFWNIFHRRVSGCSGIGCGTYSSGFSHLVQTCVQMLEISDITVLELAVSDSP